MLVGEAVDEAVQADAALHGRRIGFDGGAAAHSFGGEVAEEQVFVVGTGKDEVGEEIHNGAARVTGPAARPGS
ncbi:hypothetical protein GCM10028821_25910 [Hymenobacter jeollabukensis]